MEHAVEVWREDFLKDFPEGRPITSSTLKHIKENLYFFSGAVRVAMGLIWTDEEWEKYRKRVLNTPLP